MNKHDTCDTAVKIFFRAGYAGISKLEEEVNDWLEDHGKQVISVTPSMCSIGNLHDEIYQGVTITVWYRNLDS